MGLIARVARRLERAVRALVPRFDFVAADLTDTCHLRCTFCANDFSKATSRARMDPATFAKLVPLFELVDDGRMMLSCRFEPFLHPGFLDLVETVPAALRRKAFFTTSLTLPMTDADLDRVAALGLHHVNVSVDSLEKGPFEAIRRRARFETFADNLARMGRRFAMRRGATPVHVITVALRQNADEIPAIVARCRSELGAAHHEVRQVYDVPHLDAAWRRDNVIADARWRELRAQLAGRAVFEEPSGAPGAPVALIVSADGTVQVHSKPGLAWRLADVADPASFFRARAAELR